MTQIDTIFAGKLDHVEDFKFDAKVTAVFSNMIRRSVPGYELVTAMTAVFAAGFFQPGTAVYDLGCSLGETSRAFAEAMSEHNPLIYAVDSSPDMTAKCRENLTHFPNVHVATADVCQLKFEPASIIVCNYLIQFIPEMERDNLFKKIFDALVPGGLLLVSDKINADKQENNPKFVRIYHLWKQIYGNYSPLEIKQKREALEAVQKPESKLSLFKRLENAGFATPELWFQSLNFASVAAFKL